MAPLANEPSRRSSRSRSVARTAKAPTLYQPGEGFCLPHSSEKPKVLLTFYINYDKIYTLSLETLPRDNLTLEPSGGSMPFIELRVTQGVAMDYSITDEMIDEIHAIVASNLSIPDGVKLDPVNDFDFDLTIRGLEARGSQDVIFVVEAKSTAARQRDHKLLCFNTHQDLQRVFPELSVAVWYRLVDAEFCGANHAKR